MKFIVKLISPSWLAQPTWRPRTWGEFVSVEAPPKPIDSWEYASRDLALAHITALMISSPGLQITEEIDTKFTHEERKVSTTFTLQRADGSPVQQNRCNAWLYRGHQSWGGKLGSLPDVGYQCVLATNHQGPHMQHDPVVCGTCGHDGGFAQVHDLYRASDMIADARNLIECYERQRNEACTSMQTAHRNLGDAQLKIQRLEKERETLIEKVRIAEAVRDDARAASNLNLEEKRKISAEYIKIVEVAGHSTIETHRFLEELLAGLELSLPPGTPRTVVGIVAAVAHLKDPRNGWAQGMRDGYEKGACDGWRKGVIDSGDKMHAALMSGVQLTVSKTGELFNILAQHPPSYDEVIATVHPKLCPACQKDPASRGPSACFDCRMLQLQTMQQKGS